jgi:hypothetical protein
MYVIIINTGDYKEVSQHRFQVIMVYKHVCNNYNYVYEFDGK